MNATFHSELSAKRRGGTPECYYKLHDFIDSSKEVESSNRHRFLTHTMFFVKNAMIPIFGATIPIPGGKSVNTKDMLESDHILADYGNKFIPTLSDFSDAIEDSSSDHQLINDFQSDNSKFFERNTDIRDVMLAPLTLTGKLKSLYATHNSWFIGAILPKIYPNVKLELRNYNIPPSTFFNRMEYKKWMQNGQDTPPSFSKIAERRKNVSRAVVFDGSVRPIPVPEIDWRKIAVD